MNVIKRDGSLVPFDFNKIKNAVNKAFNSVHGCDAPDDFINYLEAITSLFDRDKTVEDIQKVVIYSLGEFKYFDVQIAYIEYKNKHDDSRFIKERIDYMDSYSNSGTNAASSSETDANSNVSIKNVANLEGEVYKTQNRLVQRARMKDKLNEMYPEVAKKYIEDLENHIIYTHDEASTPVLKYYCCAVTLYPLMTDGVGNMDGVTPSPPNDIASFSGQITNLIFLLSSQCKGAVAVGDYFIALNYYVIKEFGFKWYDRLDEVITTNINESHDVKYYIRKGMKQFIYGVNQPAGNRSFNSPFSNVSYYDSVYFKSLFGDFYYPDGTQPEWKAIDILQRMFMQLHRELRLIKPLTFPVSTMALVHNNEKFLDEDYKELCANEWAKGGSFFCFNSDNPTSLASCCFSKDQKILWRSSTTGVHLTTLEELHNTKWDPEKKNLKIFHNGSWITGKSIKLPNREMYRIETFNNKCFYMTDNHINVTLKGEKVTSNLTTDDYLMFNTLPLQAIPENDEHLTYAQGFVIGAFLGDGSFGAEHKGVIYDINFSQNVEKYKKLMYYVDIANHQLGNDNHAWLNTVYNNVYPVRISSKELVAFIIKWTNWYRGTYAYNKSLNLNCLLQSYEFRRGILDGWYNTDGGNSNRCYTTSSELAEDMEVLITSLGMQSIINISDRTDEDVVIRGEVYDRNYPLYCVRWYEPANHRCNKDVENSWIKFNNSIYFKIKSIEKVEYNEEVYCIECKNKEEPYFTLPSGLITHNCRVLNEISDNTFSSTTGMTGVMTGSCNVITLNLNRIIQNWAKESFNVEDTIELWNNSPEDYKIGMRDGLVNYLKEILERIYKYQIAYKTMLYDLEDKGMFTASNAGYIYMKKLYSTIGLIGYTEAAKFLGLTVGNNNEYKDFLKLIFGTVRDENKKHSIYDKKRPFLFNSEAIPGENLAVKLYQWDKEDGYQVPEDQNLYNCYFYNPWDNTSVLDKLKLHGKEITQFTDGGQAAHINLDSHLSKEQYLKLMDIAMKNGTNYYTYNIPMSECADCHHTVNAPIQECPHCGSKHIKYWTRIIGYLTCVDNWSKERQTEQKTRIYTKEEDVKIR